MEGVERSLVASADGHQAADAPGIVSHEAQDDLNAHRVTGEDRLFGADFVEEQIEVFAELLECDIRRAGRNVAGSVTTVMPTDNGEVVDEVVDDIRPDKAVAGQAVTQYEGRAVADGAVPKPGAVSGGQMGAVVHRRILQS